MRTTRRRMLVLAFAAGFLAVGIPYWSIPCDSPAFSLPSALPDAGLVVVGCMAALARVLSPAGLVRTTLAAGASVPAAVMARVVYEVVPDPTSHNLWPFELALAVVPGFGPALAGAVAGGLAARLSRTPGGD
jgi:hypothetical protein